VSELLVNGSETMRLLPGVAAGLRAEIISKKR
jgi:hypothetical protein